jgi:8-oxo-dGTP pyrophosphatase MutT (NUDIX family)
MNSIGLWKGSTIDRPPSRQPIPPRARKVFQGKLFAVFQWEEVLFDGTVATFEKVQRPDTVLVLPVLRDGRILLSQQQQPGREPFISALGGRIEENEPVQAAAARELREEAGLSAQRYDLWYCLHPTIKVDWVVYTLIAKGLDAVGGQVLDSGERIDLLSLSFDQFVDLVTNPAFIEVEMIPHLLEAKYVPKMRTHLRAVMGLD